MTGTLHDVRAAIDQIDDELLDLICRRMALSAEVAKAKSGAVTYRPGREAEVFTRLAARAPDLPAGVTRNIWRQIMTASSAAQDRSITVAALAKAMPAAAWHFGGQLSVTSCQTMSAVADAMTAGAQYALAPVSDSDAVARWLMADTACHIIAVTPFASFVDDGDSLPRCYLIGREPADAVADETTLVACMTDGSPRIDMLAGRADDPLANYASPARVVGVIATPAKTD